jgi:FdhE protein
VIQRILEPGQIEQGLAGDIPRLRLPAGAQGFGERAARLRHLANAGPLREFLQFAALLAEHQQSMALWLAGTPLPDAQHLARCREHAMPPLAFTSSKRDPAWRRALRSALDELRSGAAEAPAAVIDRLRRESDDFLEAQASKIGAGAHAGLDLATAPLIASALQAYWTSMASRLAPGDIGAGAAPGLCPVCGSPPVASVVRIGGAASGHRYLHCSLCASEWHMVRIKCSHCESTKGISYHALQAGEGEAIGDAGVGGVTAIAGAAEGAVKAETCEQCRSYLKIFSMEKDPGVEPVADDLASLALDLLMGEENYARTGTNMMLFHAPG